MPNRECNLECVKDRKGDEEEVVEFIGPVKIVLVDRPKNSYIVREWSAALIVLAQMFIAITFIIILFYSLTYKKKGYLQGLHVFLCTAGLQLSFPIGVLNLNNLNGAAAPMHLSDRKFEHGVLQTFGLLTTTAGAIVSYYADYSDNITTHSCLGIAATILALLNAIIGSAIYIFSNFITEDSFHAHEHIFVTIHHVLGIITIILASTCLLFGIIKESFTEFLPLDDIFYFMSLFCIFYTFVVIFKPLHFLNSSFYLII